MRAATLLIVVVLTVAGCAATPARLSVPPEPSAVSERVSVRSVLVGDISLPEYANAPEVVRETEDGLIETLPGVIWADVPQDAMANAIVRNLSQTTGVSVARAPWPLSSFPDAEVTIRVERMLLEAGGQLDLSGQFAIRRDRGAGSERIRTFDLTVPVAGAELTDIADAHATAWRALAEQIAGDL